MVLTRSRNASPSAAGASVKAEAQLQLPAPDMSCPRGDDTSAAEAVVVVPQPAAGAAAAPVAMTTEQLMLLIDRLSHREAVSTPTPSYSGNFAKCTARFDGEKSSDVLAFIDAIETYKECVRVDDNNALRGLSMLLTGIAATWWHGVKDSTTTWSAAIDALKQTFGPRLPPSKLYRKVFEREQRIDETTDLFVCHIRALFAQLPPCSLSEAVQLDMTYGLLHRRIREKVARSSFENFAQLLTEARRVEEILDESRPQVTSDSNVRPSTSRPSTAPGHGKTRSHCNYCKQYGHLKEACPRLAKGKSTAKEEVVEAKQPAITCFGCGTPGVIRSNCATCKEKKAVVSSCQCHTVSASDDKLDSRVRPVISAEIEGAVGTFLVDTSAKHCIGSVSLRSYLASKDHVFHKVFTELKYADGRIYKLNVEVTNVKVTVRGVTLLVSFIMLPNATESLLGMNFIRDVGMVLDFDRGVWAVRGDRSPQRITFENTPIQSVTCSSVGLREDEGSHLGSDERGRLSDLLDIYEDIFAPGGGPTKFAVHHIDTGDAAPIASPPYRVTPSKKEIIKKEIDKMLEDEIIEEAESEWASPVVLIPKKNGETRFCVDYRKLNSVTRTDKYPLPVIDDLLQSTKPNCVMSTIDLKAGYWQTMVAPEDRPKTAFTTPFGTFQFRRMPFGLKNAPATFQRLIDRMRSGLKDVCVLAYLDDILIISPHLDQHLNDLAQVFERLKLFNLRANRAKCVFARDRVVYLGHVISSQGIEPDQDKVQAVVKMAPPVNLKQLKSFLQTCSWFRKFISNFSEVAQPLTDLTKKNRPWKWGEKEVEAFNELKRRLTASPILRQPDFEQPFILRTDASNYALGAVLMQGPDPQSERPIEYASRLLNPAERNYSTTEREALAVVWALDKFRGYLEGAQVCVATDHQPLKWLLSLKTPSGRLARWAMKIQAYNLNVEYTPGKVNVVADTLSRPVPVSPTTDDDTEDSACDLCSVSVDLPHRNPEELRAAQLEDPEIKKILDDFGDGDTAVRWTDRGYYLSNGVLFRFDPDGESEEPQFVVPDAMRMEVMKELHDAPTAGHLGLERTLRKVKERFYFPHMRQFIAKYLKACDLCQKYKPTNLKPFTDSNPTPTI